MTSNNDVQLCTVHDLCNMLNVNNRRVTQLVKQNIIIRVTHGNYDLHQSIRNYVDYLKSRINNSPDLADERELLTRRKRELLEFDLAVKRGEYITIDDVQKSAFNDGRKVRDSLLNIPARISSKLSTLDDTKDIQDILTDEIELSLERLDEHIQ